MGLSTREREVLQSKSKANARKRQQMRHCATAPTETHQASLLVALAGRRRELVCVIILMLTSNLYVFLCH